MQETWIWSLGWEDSLEESTGEQPTPVFLPGESQWTAEPGRLKSVGLHLTADGDCIHEIKRRLLLGRKAMTNLDSVLKNWDITLPTHVHIVKAMVFLVAMYGCESWIIKKAECQGIDAFELQCWGRLLKVPCTARRSNQSILKEINPEYSLDWCWGQSCNTLATWCEEPTHWKRPGCWARLKVGGKGDNRGWDGWMSSMTQWTWVWACSGRWWRSGKLGMLQSMGSQRVDMTEWLNKRLLNWDSE